MDRLDSALKKIKKKKEMKEAVVSGTLAALGKGAMVVAKAGAKAAKVGAKAGAKGAKAGGKVVKSGTKVVNPKVMGGEVKKSAQIAKNVKPKSGPTIDVKATEVGGEVAKSKKATMSSKSSTPKTKYGKSKGGEIQKSEKGDITKGKNQVDPQKKPEAEKPKDEPKVDDKKPEKKKKGKNPDVAGAISRAYGKTSFSVKEQKTFRNFLEEVSPLLEE